MFDVRLAVSQNFKLHGFSCYMYRPIVKISAKKIEEILISTMDDVDGYRGTH